ncbi:MAG: hypothetical protein GVY08_14740 [Bacteroidetes bacterium]|nr:hypothetical protein [Bacteroidota bacterium]
MKDKKDIYLLGAFVVLLFTSFSCSKESNKQGIIIHPIDDKIPHSNVPVEMLEVLNAGNYLDEIPENARLLYQILSDDSNEKKLEELDVMVTDKLDIQYLNDSTLLILDKEQNQLILYDLNDHETDVIAEQGRGPGDLFFSKELSVHNSKAYVGMQGFQIAVFNCQSGNCEHEKVIQTDYNNYSLAPTKDSIYFLGIAPFGRAQDPDPGNTDQFVIHRSNYEGDIDVSFLQIYDDKSPIVRDRMMSSGEVRVFTELNRAIITFHYFPYLFTYNSDGELIAKYEIPNFIQAKNLETEGDGIGTTLTFDGDYTYLSNTSKLSKRWLLLKMRQYRNVEYKFSEKSITGETWYTYFVFDVKNKKIYKIGDDSIKPYGQSNLFYLVKSGVIMNNNGKLYWTSI